MEWQAVALLGAYHGINPGMGWLFAVALGLQQGSARGLVRAVPPIVAGHALSIAVFLVAAGLARVVVPPGALEAFVAVLLISIGAYRLRRHGHPRFGGMQVGAAALTLWSFLMATAHGAGLMVLPFVMATPGTLAAAGHEHVHHVVSRDVETGVMALTVHTLTYLAVLTATAWVVYRKLGLGLLRTAWFNTDRAWAIALVVTGLVVLFA